MRTGIQGINYSCHWLGGLGGVCNQLCIVSSIYKFDHLTVAAKKFVVKANDKTVYYGYFVVTGINKSIYKQLVMKYLWLNNVRF